MLAAPALWSCRRALERQDVAGRKVTFIEDGLTTVCAIWRGAGTPHIVGVPAMPVLPVFTRAELMLDV